MQKRWKTNFTHRLNCSSIVDLTHLGYTCRTTVVSVRHIRLQYFISVNFLHHKGLGHSRLSIIDIEGGQQPLHDHENNVHVVVNGELYDYVRLRHELEAKGAVFQTNSDSELVVHLYVIF